jgi:hypothetical protein
VFYCPGSTVERAGPANLSMGTAGAAYRTPVVP